MEEQELCKKRLMDLSRQADRKGIAIYGDFLNLNEQDICHAIESQLATRVELFGGFPGAERLMAAFVPGYGGIEGLTPMFVPGNYAERHMTTSISGHSVQKQRTAYVTSTDADKQSAAYLPDAEADAGFPEYPISTLKVAPAYPKYAEQLTHRDILGAVMSLGINRGRLGDIVVGEGSSYLFCAKELAPYIMENLTQVRHTAVRITETDASEVEGSVRLKEVMGTVSSNRLDAAVSCAYNVSRSTALDLLRGEKVFVNGRLIQNPSHSLESGDIVSVRGRGRFVFDGVGQETKKGKLRIKYRLYL